MWLPWDAYKVMMELSWDINFLSKFCHTGILKCKIKYKRKFLGFVVMLGKLQELSYGNDDPV